MKKGALLIAAAATCLAAWGFADLASAEPGEAIVDTDDSRVSFRGCIYYEHSGYRGARVNVSAGTHRRYVGSAWNDRISSAACAYYCSMTVFEHRDYAGASETFVDNHYYVGGFWNDKISSLKVECRDPPPPTAEQEGRLPGMENNTDRPGADMDRIPGRNPMQCRRECENRPSCRAWTYVRPTFVRTGVQGPTFCYVKWSKPNPVRNACCISGVKPDKFGPGGASETGPIAPWQPGPGDTNRE